MFSVVNFPWGRSVHKGSSENTASLKLSCAVVHVTFTSLCFYLLWHIYYFSFTGSCYRGKIYLRVPLIVFRPIVYTQFADDSFKHFLPDNLLDLNLLYVEICLVRIGGPISAVKQIPYML